MNFSEALELLKKRKRVARTGWNGKGMWIAIHNPSEHTAETRHVQVMTLPFICMRTAGEIGELVPWLASQTDILAEDWVLHADSDRQVEVPS